MGTSGGVVVLTEADQVIARYRREGDDPKSLSSNRVLFIREDASGVVWIGTFNGLNRKESDGFRRYGVSDGLAHESVSSMMESSDGSLRFGTQSGICRYDPASVRFSEFSEGTGLRNEWCETNAHAKSPDGRFYYGGARGLDSFLPDSLEHRTRSSEVAITSVEGVNEEFLPWYRAHELPFFEASSKETFLTFSMAVLDYSNTSQNRFRHRLIGLSSEWTDPTDLRFARYANLGPGKYTFQAQGSVNGGVWGEVASVPFTITPQYWQTLWFRLGLIALIALLAFAIHSLVRFA